MLINAEIIENFKLLAAVILDLHICNLTGYYANFIVVHELKHH